jgi:hypothetical protein
METKKKEVAIFFTDQGKEMSIDSEFEPEVTEHHESSEADAVSGEAEAEAEAVAENDLFFELKIELSLAQFSKTKEPIAIRVRLSLPLSLPPSLPPFLPSPSFDYDHPSVHILIFMISLYLFSITHTLSFFL